jgi:hypothetical protein
VSLFWNFERAKRGTPSYGIHALLKRYETAIRGTAFITALGAPWIVLRVGRSDIVRAFSQYGELVASMQVKDIMTHGLITASLWDDLTHLMRLMTRLDRPLIPWWIGILEDHPDCGASTSSICKALNFVAN